MQNYWPTVIGRQMAAAIQLLRAAVEACPDDLWDDRTEGTPYWHMAYHALFFTDLYLTDNLESFQAQSWQADKSHFLPGDYQEFAGIVTTPEKSYTREQLVEYADHCLRKCDACFKKLTDERALERCGFWWYELNAGEFLLNNLRHTQHHAGQLIVLLRRHSDIGIEWLGTRDNQPPPPTW